MSDQLQKMRELVNKKKAANSNQKGKLRPEKNLVEGNFKVTKQHKKGGLFDGK
ncbi:hypothetical protein EV586_11412 [Tumebacillus sp. BK434]|uniref:hypothetical protein n=1 Tax=Tumebacillus sp. BK434 TaxID=2512169 RepID=UPI0010D323A9|nr:hypothetical protein [Tumebacillus sp. BK434]TCP52161.1 hypothetical protein EV586_11412 [Tumebacillus sp. BK434]